MRIRPFTRLSTDDFRGAEPWFITFLETMNPMIDTLNSLVQNNINIDDNLLAERQTVLLSHGVPVTIKLRKLRQQPYFVRVGYAAGHVGTGAVTGYNSDGSVQVTVYFSGTIPTTPVLTTIVLEP